jgi:hypothetical protein
VLVLGQHKTANLINWRTGDHDFNYFNLVSLPSAPLDALPFSAHALSIKSNWIILHKKELRKNRSTKNREDEQLEGR